MSSTHLDAELKGMLTRAGISDEVLDVFVRMKCTTVSHFANWVDTRADLHKAFLNNVQAAMDDDAQLARLKMCWREAEALYSKRLKRQSEGLLEEVLDQPLDETVQETIEKAFRDKYAWPVLAPDRIGCDSLLGRCHREFQAYKPSMFPVSRVKTVATVQKKEPAAKRQCGGGVSIVIERDEDDEAHAILSFLEFIDGLDILGNTWTVAGSFDAKSADFPGFFCQWPKTCAYTQHIRREGTLRLREYTEMSVLACAVAAEEAFRCKAIEFVRGDRKFTWGYALEAVTKEHAHIWQDKGDLLVKRARLSPGRLPIEERPPPRSQPRSQAPASSGGIPKKHWLTSRTDASGANICQ